MKVKQSLPTRFSVDTILALNRIPRVKKIAESASQCSTLPYEGKIPIENAREAMAAIFAVSILIPERGGYLKMSILDKIAHQARYYEYNGKWRLVQELLETENIPYYISKKLCEHFSGNDLYGNFLDLVKEKAQQLKLYLPQERYQKVNYPQRKRGYSDKGTLRLPHKWKPDKIQMSANPEREDRTSFSYTPRNSAFWLNKIWKGFGKDEPI